MNKKYSVDEALTQMMTVKNAVMVIVTAIVFVILGLLLRGHGGAATSYETISKLQVTQYAENEKVMTLNSSDPVFLNTYLENLKNKQTQKAVKKELAKKDLKLSVAEIDSMMSIESVPQTTILKLKISGDTKKTVKLVSRAYNQVALQQYKKDMKTGSVKVVDSEYSKKTTITRMSTKKVVFFAGVLGLFLSAGLIFLRKYFNQKIVNRHFIENRTVTPVITDVSENNVQEIATDLIARIQNDYQVIGATVTDESQVELLNRVVNQLKEWQFNIKQVTAQIAFTEETTIIPETEDQLILVVGHLEIPQERLALTKVDAMFTVVQAKVTTKDQLLAIIKFTKEATIPFIGSLYLK